MVVKVSRAYLDPTRWSCGSFREQQPIDHAQTVLLDAALADPTSWVWDPRLVELFDRLNARYFEGRVRPHRLFWFHEEQLKQHQLDTPALYNRISFTYGFRSDRDGELVIGLHLRMKVMPDKLRETMRHEATHDVSEQCHGEAFLRALHEQGPGEPWVEEQLKSYTASNLVGDVVRQAMMRPWKPGDGHDPDADLKAVRAAIDEHGFTLDELHRSIEMMSPNARVAVLRAVELDVL